MTGLVIARIPPYRLMSVGRTRLTRYLEITIRIRRTNPAEIPPVAMFLAFIKKMNG